MSAASTATRTSRSVPADATAPAPSPQLPLRLGAGGGEFGRVPDPGLTIARPGPDPDALEEVGRTARAEYLPLLALGLPSARAELIAGPASARACAAVGSRAPSNCLALRHPGPGSATWLPTPSDARPTQDPELPLITLSRTGPASVA
jgi:hypothetical protein